MLVLPDGCMDLLVLDRRVMVAGPDTAAFRSAAAGPVHGIRFPPGVLSALLGVPAAALQNQRVALHDLTGSMAPEGPLDPDARPSDLLDDIAARLLRLHGDGVAAEASAAVRAVTGGASVCDAAARLGWSERQFRRFCHQRFGYGAATLRRILRLQRALDRYRTGATLTDAAAGAGFADHAHLTRTWRHFTGLAPSGLVTVQRSSGA